MQKKKSSWIIGQTFEVWWSFAFEEQFSEAYFFLFSRFLAKILRLCRCNFVAFCLGKENMFFFFSNLTVLIALRYYFKYFFLGRDVRVLEKPDVNLSCLLLPSVVCSSITFCCICCFLLPSVPFSCLSFSFFFCLLSFVASSYIFC